MTKLTGITPTPRQAADAYRQTFESAIDAAGGKDGRISRASAERLAERSDAGKLVADNIINFLDKTGQKTVGAKKFAEVVTEYVRRQAEEAAGPNQRLSLVEIRTLNTDLVADLLHMRGKDNLAEFAPPVTLPTVTLPTVRFDENEIYDLLVNSDPVWKPTEVADQGSLSSDGTDVVIEGLSGVRDDWKPAVEKALERTWSWNLRHQYDGQPLELGQVGTMRVGEVIDADSGKPGLLVHWNDLDDASFAFFYNKNDRGNWVRKHEVFMN